MPVYLTKYLLNQVYSLLEPKNAIFVAQESFSDISAHTFKVINTILL